MSGQWQVKAFDNFGAPGEADVFDLGICDSLEQAIAWAKHHVYKSLEENVPLSVSVADLISRYHTFGEETVVFNLDDDSAEDFSARDYAHAIASEVFQEWNQTDVDPALRAAYRDTDYVVALLTGEVVIRIGAPVPAVDAWLVAQGVRSALLLSAENPMSRPLEDQTNAARHAELVALVRKGDWPFIEAVGRSPDGNWSENSLLIVGIGTSETNDLARRFEQAGYVWINRGEPPSLRLRTTQGTWVEEGDLT